MNGYCCKENKISMDLREEILIRGPFIFIFERIANDVLYYVFQTDDIEQKMALEPCEKDVEADSLILNNSYFESIAQDTYYNIPCLDNKINLMGLLSLISVEINKKHPK